MLSLEAPFHVIKGVCLYRDHEDPLQWYAMPGAPRFSTVAETVNGVELQIPQMQLIRFKGEAGTGGFLNFDVDLSIEDVREEIVGEIKRVEHLDGTPRVAPLPVVDGGVRMMLFDAATPPPHDGNHPAPADPPRDEDEALKFVLKIDHAAKPALYGDQRAAFSVQLTKEGVTTFEKAMRGELSPIGIVYQLDYLGLRPAYHVSINVDWDRVQHEMASHKEFQVPLIYSSSIDKVVDELIDKRVIDLKVDTFDVETGDSAVLARRDEAINDIKDMITDTFFKPSLDPVDRSNLAGDTISSVARVIRAVGSGGMSEFKAFTRREIDVTRIDKKSLDVSMSERSTVKRSIYPQGHLSGLFRLLQQPGLDMSRFVIDVDLDDPWFQRRQVRVIPRANFDKDAISSIHVDMDYQGTQKSVLLTKDSGEQNVSWASVLRDGAMVPEVTARYTVTFGDIDGTERPKTLVSDPVTIVDGNLEVDPRQLYSMVTIPLECTLFPWDRYGSVEVALKHDDEANQIAQSDVIVLNKEKPASDWLMFVRDPERKSFSYRVRYLSADHADREEPWKDTDEQRITLRDPLRAQLQLDVVPVVKWAETDRVFVDVRYADDVNQIFEQGSFEFTENAGGTQTFRVRIADVHRRRFEYEVTVIMKSTEVIKVPRSETAENRIIVREDMRGHRIIDIGLAPVDFAALRIKKVAADLVYEDTDHGLNLGKAVTFTSADAVDTFEYDYVEGGPEDYQFQYRITFTNNLTKGKAWAPSHDNPLRIDIS